jgi:uncharacterized protein YjbI with pentapeptide repeats
MGARKTLRVMIVGFLLPSLDHTALTAEPANLARLRQENSCVGCNLSAADLSNGKFVGADLTGATLVDAKLVEADLKGAKLSRANLIGANLENAALHDADLSNAEMSKVNLSGAFLNPANLSGARLPESFLANANFSGADLTRASFYASNLTNAAFIGANLRDANFASANLTEADLSRTDMSRAVLINANLQDAYLRDANLSAANLSGANLSGSYMAGVNLSGTNLSGADLSEALFEPATVPPVASFQGVRGLDKLWWDTSPHSLVLLRHAFKEAGLRQQEREVTYAHLKWQRAKNGGLEGAFQYVLFELTTKWGMSPARAFWVLLGLIPVFALLYLLPIYRPSEQGAVWRVWDKDRTQSDKGQDAPEQLISRDYRLAVYALFFSVLSAFHIGWRELNVGSWITRLNPYEFTLRGTGWVRTVSGVQSLISVYLLALAVLTYFGRPFE